MTQSIQEEKTDFFLVSAHELRTSLAATKWLFAMLLGGDLGPLTAEQKTMLTEAQNSNERMIALISEVLTAMRSEQSPALYKMSALDLDKLILETVNLFQQEAHQHQMFIRYIPHEETVITADETRMRIVLHNLIENAIKYGRENTDITISLTHSGTDAVLSIRDRGIGIPAQDQAKLFERFFRARNAETKESGAGLGLYAIKQIITRHGGTVVCESTEGVGTTFRITLPLAV